MIAVDTNILVYAHRPDSPWHTAAAGCVRGLAEDKAPWCIPWPCIHEFLAVATHPRVYDPPTPLDAALDQVDAWMESPSLVIAGEAPAHWEALSDILRRSRVVGPKVHDARIAAICVAQGVRTLWSADRDLSRFTLIRSVNPLVPAAG